jgi:HSP20 family protein
MTKQELQVRNEEGKRERWLAPFSSIHEAEDGKIVVRLEMPGISKDELGIEVENSELRITGKRPEREVQGEFLIRERRDGSFYRAFTLDDTIDPDKTEASMEAGVLTVTLHRKEAEKPRKITVQSG